MIPFQAQPVGALKERLVKLLERTTEDLPSDSRDNVFDFEGGLRIVVSRRTTAEGSIKIGFTGQPFPGSYLAKKVGRHYQAAKAKGDKAGIQQVMASFNHHVVTRFILIATGFPENSRIAFTGYEERGIPHFSIIEGPKNERAGTDGSSGNIAPAVEGTQGGV